MTRYKRDGGGEDSDSDDDEDTHKDEEHVACNIAPSDPRPLFMKLPL
jgi:hypothetical protein